jgi:hypothetical protein
VGAQVRLVLGEGRYGPCRSVQAGSGYWSQDAAAQVLGFAGPRPTAVWVRWPDGSPQTVPLDDKAWEVRIRNEARSK